MAKRTPDDNVLLYAWDWLETYEGDEHDENVALRDEAVAWIHSILVDREVERAANKAVDDALASAGRTVTDEHRATLVRAARTHIRKSMKKSAN